MIGAFQNHAYVELSFRAAYRARRAMKYIVRVSGIEFLDFVLDSYVEVSLVCAQIEGHLFAGHAVSRHLLREVYPR